MSLFEVQYSYSEIKDDMIIVEADSLDHAEKVALDKLSDILPPEVSELCIEGVKQHNV